MTDQFEDVFVTAGDIIITVTDDAEIWAAVVTEDAVPGDPVKCVGATAEDAFKALTGTWPNTVHVTMEGE